MSAARQNCCRQTIVYVAGWYVSRASPCPGDRQKAVILWLASGRRHAENETLKNCRVALSLFPRDVHSGSFLCIYQSDRQANVAFKSCASRTGENKEVIV